MDDGKKNELRSGVMGDGQADKSNVELVEHVTSDGKALSFEVRAPSLADARAISRLCLDKKTKEVDTHRFVVLTLIACTYVPGTNDKVFTPADEDALFAQRPGKNSVITKLVKALQRVQAVDAEEEEKN